MKNAFILFLKLEQTYNKNQSYMKAMALKFNANLNRLGLNRNIQYFVRKIRTGTANRMEMGE